MRANDIRKNFVFKKEVATQLEELAKKNKKSMTLIVQELIQKEYSQVNKEEKLKALYEFASSSEGLFDDLKVQDIKLMIGKDMMKRCKGE